jgi:hypothetical protein
MTGGCQGRESPSSTLFKAGRFEGGGDEETRRVAVGEVLAWGIGWSVVELTIYLAGRLTALFAWM